MKNLLKCGKIKGYFFKKISVIFANCLIILLCINTVHLLELAVEVRLHVEGQPGGKVTWIRMHRHKMFTKQCV